ncbi:hypothetical protein IEO21_01379 [Rhodonia placenta]|uniref:K Homology domain-containing protein n=1 Tax=Rhodonia placenta TaxID=104341 RepID=A0A8H7U5C2_9APHY|nr:hypothetical protein IEO21_01379 [Postia placenta]
MSESLTAAELQKKHGIEDAQELNGTPPAAVSPAPANGHLDTGSQEAFPSLAPSPVSQSANKPAGSAWGSSAGPRIRPAVTKQIMFSDSFILSSSDIATAGRDGKPISLGQVMKQVMVQHKVKIEASTNQKSRQTTFFLKAEYQKDLDKAKRSLLALLSPVSLCFEHAKNYPKRCTHTHERYGLCQPVLSIVSLVLQAPVSTIPSLVGAKGANLIRVREQTGVRIDIPRRDTLPAVNGNAQAMLKETIAERRSSSTQRVRDIPAHILPFLIPLRASFMAADGNDVQLVLNKDTGEIAVTGEHDAVGRVAEKIRSAMAYFTGEVSQLKLTLPKRQHRLLTGSGADEVMAKSKCAVLIPKPEEASEEIVVWGKQGELAGGVQAVMEKANSAYIHEFPLPGPIATSRQLLTYITRVDFAQTLSDANPGVSVYTPPLSAMDKATVLNVDMVGDKPAVDAAVSQFSALIGKLIGATKDVQIDWLVQPIINSHKNAEKIKAFHEVHNVLVFFPPESAELSSVLLVYDPTSPSASPSPVDKAKSLEDVEQDLLKLARDAADVKTETITVEKKWHEAVIGRGGTTLNAIIGEDKTLSIKFGAEVSDASTEDVIRVRGIRGDVDRAVKVILKIVEDAKNDEIESSYSTEFAIDKEFVGRIVGAGGAGVNKIRDLLGVKIDFADDVDDKEKEVSKKKKAVHAKSRVTIVGRKENVEEAKRRITNTADRLADETSEVLKIPHKYHAGLIGPSGKEPLKPDEVLVKGGKKGVANAKSELADAVEFEKESNHEIKFTVPSRAVARILGKSGATINEIKDRTGVQIDVDRVIDDKETNITVRGTKTAIADAKEAILEISDQVGEETTDSLNIESRFHRTIIGAGGQGLKELIIRCGGPTDSKTQAGLVRFPRQGEPSDEVRLRGEPKLVAKLKAELETTVAALRDRVVLAVEVPAAQHRTLIGRGGQHLNELQNRTGAQVQFPGSRSYHPIGEAENASDLEGVDPADIVKVVGPRAACLKAVEELKTQIKPPAPEAVTGTMTVPLKYHHAVTQQGNLFRTLRFMGTQTELSRMPSKPAVPPHPQAGPTEARIDDADDAAGHPEVQWQVVPNYQDAEEGEAEWTFKARDQESLDKALKLTQDAIEHAETMSHVGFLTLPDRSSFPRIVGGKGSNVARLRNETGADITVSREDTTITIIGSESAIEAAKEAILKTATNNRPRGRRDA